MVGSGRDLKRTFILNDPGLELSQKFRRSVVLLHRLAFASVFNSRGARRVRVSKAVFVLVKTRKAVKLLVKYVTSVLVKKRLC